MSSLAILNMIQEQVIRYVYPVWLLLGITGCLLNLIVFSRRQLRQTSCCIYFLAASLDHLFTLIIGIAPALYSLDHPDPRLNYLWFCKLRGYLFQISLMLSRWFVVFACIDRYALTSEHVRLRRMATKKNCYRIIAVIVVFWSIICTHRLVFYQIEGNLCAIVNNVAAAVYHSVYVIIGGGLLPSLIMIISAILIRRNLYLKKMRRVQLNSNEQRQSSLDYQVQKILFAQIIFYVILTTPQLINVILNAIVITVERKSDDLRDIERFISFMAEVMLFLFPVTSFYLYTLTSRTFRTELIKFFRLSILFANRVKPVIEGTTRTRH